MPRARRHFRHPGRVRHGFTANCEFCEGEKKAAPGAGAAYNTVSGFLRWAPELRECSHQLIESRIDRIHADPDPNTVAGVFIHSAVVDFTLVTPVDVPGNNAFLIVPNSLQVASLFENGVML